MPIKRNVDLSLSQGADTVHQWKRGDHFNFPRSSIENGCKAVFASAARPQRRMGTSGAFPLSGQVSPEHPAEAVKIKDRKRQAPRGPSQTH